MPVSERLGWMFFDLVALVVSIICLVLVGTWGITKEIAKLVRKTNGSLIDHVITQGITLCVFTIALVLFAYELLKSPRETLRLMKR